MYIPEELNVWCAALSDKSVVPANLLCCAAAGDDLGWGFYEIHTDMGQVIYCEKCPVSAVSTAVDTWDA